MGARVHFTRHNSYNTRSNKVRHVRTPGGRLTAQYVTKVSKGPQNAMVTSTKKLGGLKRMRPTVYRRTNKTSRRVCRAYGGVFSHDEVKNRIIRTFSLKKLKTSKRLWLYKLPLNLRKIKRPR